MFYYVLGRVPVVLMVRTRSPRVGILPHPLPWVVHSPLTRVKEKFFSSAVQCARLDIRLCITHHHGIAQNFDGKNIWSVNMKMKILNSKIIARNCSPSKFYAYSSYSVPFQHIVCEDPIGCH